MTRVCWITCLALAACTGSVASSRQDATIDHEPSDVSIDASTDLTDRASIRDIVDVRDVADVPDAGRCPPTLPDGGAPPPPPGVSRSCGPGGAPAWHCNEVPYCGGEFMMGSTNAAEIRGHNDRVTFRMRACDPRVRQVRGGYIDAYEVTVARFRQWVRAGMPMPAEYAEIYPVGTWTSSGLRVSSPDYANSGDGDTVAGNPATVRNCTWSPIEGVNDDLPVNCVDWLLAVGFCWWDGRHIVSEEAWEYLASNYGTTSSIRPENVALSSSCALGDLNARNGICVRRDLPMAVNTFPLSGPPMVPGLFGMIGGVQEIAAGPFAPLDGICTVNGLPIDRCCHREYPITDDHSPREGGAARGSSWWVNEEDQHWLNHVSSRSHSLPRPAGDQRPVRSPNAGIRCARWVIGVW